MKKLMHSEIAAALLIIIIIAIMALTFKMRTQWWMFTDIFFAFMMVFMHFMALMLERISKSASQSIDKIAMAMGCCFVISFVVEFVLFYT